jgi:hypothetical protein
MPSKAEIRDLIMKLAFSMTLDEAFRFMKLSPGATSDEIKKAYRQLSLEFHPDRNPGNPAAEEDMKRLNVAREIIESGGSRKPVPPTSEPRDESQWIKYRTQYGPKPSGNYSTSDLDRFAKEVLDNRLYQIIVRYKVDGVPGDAGTNRGGHWSYYRPFGGKTNTQRMAADMTPEKLMEALKKWVRGPIFDLVVKPKEAWVTFEDGRYYQSISFEEPKSAPKKVPGVGMTKPAVAEFLKSQGLAVVAGGTKYAYWGPKGRTEKTGRFLREAVKSLRPVKRDKTGYANKIEDNPMLPEVYYGKMTPDLLTKWASWTKQ